MFFRQLFDAQTSTYTYLLADEVSGEAVIIDPVKELVERDVTMIRELGLTLVASLETHVHADHVTGATELKKRLGQAILYPSTSGAVGADGYLDEGASVAFGSRHLTVRLTPGHTAGCATYIADDESMAFTGDALLIRGSGRTDFQGGDAHQLWRSVHQQIFSLPDATRLYPGHDYKGRTVTTVGEEKAHNPRLGGSKTVEEFAAIMDQLGLAYPRHIDRALPANLALGVEAEDAPAQQDTFADLPRNERGARQVTTEWVQQFRGEYRIIDVRELEEWNGPLGHLDEAELVPLATVGDQAAAWPKDEPLVVLCRAGGRSDRAALLLEQAGFTQVASMTGGMLAFRSAQDAPSRACG
jgi:sulfur dioxygenase